MTTTWTLIGSPDDGDPFVEDFKTQAEAVTRGVQILLWEDDGWTETEAARALRAGSSCRLGDAGELVIEKRS